jgi:hypothetical protein
MRYHDPVFKSNLERVVRAKTQLREAAATGQIKETASRHNLWIGSFRFLELFIPSGMRPILPQSYMPR